VRLLWLSLFWKALKGTILLQRVICNRPRTVQTGREERLIRQIGYSFSSSDVACRWSKHLRFLSLCGRQLRDVQDILRGQYQQLSADPGSLANLDQGNYTPRYVALLLSFLFLDLPNNIQDHVPIVGAFFSAAYITYCYGVLSIR
jgi:hypothetical protein